MEYWKIGLCSRQDAKHAKWRARPVIPSGGGGSEKRFLPEFTLSLAEGVEMTMRFSLRPLRSLRLTVFFGC